MILEDFYAHPWLFLFNWAAKTVGRHCRIVVLVQSFHHYDQKKRFLNAVDRFIAALFLRPVDLVIANSQETADECVRLGVLPRHIIVVYPGCDFAGQPISRQEEGRRGHLLHLLTVANYDPRKGLHHLIEAMALIRRCEPDLFRGLKLWMVGNPHDNPSYTRQLAEMIETTELQASVHLLGWCEREQVGQLLAKSDIFVFPTLQEGFGMVLAEAMYYGLPIVACRAGAVPELIEHEDNGLLVKPGDAQELAQAILRLTRDAGLRAKLGENARNAAGKFVHGWDAVGQEFHQALAGLARGTTEA